MEEKVNVKPEPKKESKGVNLVKKKSTLVTPLLILLFIVTIGACVVFFTDIENAWIESLMNSKDSVQTDLSNPDIETTPLTDLERREVEEYVVKEGDTLSSIASAFYLKVNTIKVANDMTSDDIEVGETLRIPPMDGVLVIIKEGDTLASLAEEYDTDSEVIADFNWLDYPFDLEVGTEIFIPEKEVETTNTDTTSLVNEGWSLYSVPEYGFSVEVPGTYHSTENSTDTRWEVSRKSLGQEYFSDSEEISHIEEISINYFKEGLVYETRACGLGCNGEIYINIYIDKLNDVQTLDTVKSNIQEDFESRQDYLDGYSNEFTDISGDENMFNRSVWCAQLPNMEGLGFKNCYFDTSDYRVQVKFMGFNKEELEDSQSLDMYNIVETIKFE